MMQLPNSKYYITHRDTELVSVMDMTTFKCFCNIKQTMWMTELKALSLGMYRWYGAVLSMPTTIT